MAAYRERADSWNDPQHHAAIAYAGPKTEADLSAMFQSRRLASSDLSLKEVLKADWESVTGFLARHASSFKQHASNVRSAKDVARVIAKPFPLVSTLANYKMSYVVPDGAAGLVEGVMKIPSGLAYASLCNMPSEYGLYTSLLPPFIYMLLGTCAQISFGMTAIEALFLGESVSGVLGDDLVEAAIDEEAPDAAALDIVVKFTLFFSFMAGVWQLLFRVFRLYYLSVLLADPVMSGFSTGGAFVIATSQLSSFLGISLSKTEECLPKIWVDAFKQITDWNWATIGLGLAGWALLIGLKAANKKFLPRFPLPWQIVIVILSIVVTSSMELSSNNGVSVVKDIPSGFPSAGFPHIPTVPGKTSSDLFVSSLFPSFLLALFVYVMSLSLGTFFAGKNGYKVDASQELVAVGAGNVLGPLCGSVTCSASFSRTAVVNTLGSKTVMHTVTALIILILAVTLITEQLYYLPKTTLAVIVFDAVGPMLEFKHGANYYMTSKPDSLVWVVTFIFCIMVGAMEGIYAGVALALLIVLWRSATAKVVVLGRLPGTNVYRDVRRFPMAKEATGVKIVRFDGGLNFANWEKLVSQLQVLVTKDIHTVVLDASAIVSVDSSALRGILELLENFESKDIKMLLANWKGPQRDLLERSGFYRAVSDGCIFLNLHDAVLFAKMRPPSPSAQPDTAAAAAKDPATITEAGGHVWRVGFADPSLHQNVASTASSS